MVAVVVPVGQASGPVFEGAEEPTAYEVRVGEVICGLNAEEYALWGLAHGEPDRLADGAWDRRAVLAEARRAAVADPDKVLDALIEDGLVVDVDPDDPEVRVFGAAHRLFPLAVGLGNNPADPETYGIGFPDAPRIGLPRHAFHLWLLAPASPSIWAACQTLSADLRAGGETDPELVSPQMMLGGLVSMLPVLVSTGCAFLDRCLG